MTKSVFITGGSGLLGVNWAAVVRDRVGVTLAMHDRQITMRRVRTCVVNLASVDSLAHALEASDADQVVHTASMTNVDACERDPDTARRVNVDLAVNVALACRRVGIPLVHISTDHLFGAHRAIVTEDDRPTPTNAYGRTKAEAEARVRDAKADALVIRTNFYGWGPRYRQSFTDGIIAKLRANERVTLFRDVQYSPILVEPLVLAIHELIDRRATGLYHVVGDEHLSKHEFGLRVAAQFGFDGSLVAPGSLDDRRDLVARPRYMCLSNERATRFLGRRLGGVTEHLAWLQQQESSDATREIRLLGAAA